MCAKDASRQCSAFPARPTTAPAFNAHDANSFDQSTPHAASRCRSSLPSYAIPVVNAKADARPAPIRPRRHRPILPLRLILHGCGAMRWPAPIRSCSPNPPSGVAGNGQDETQRSVRRLHPEKTSNSVTGPIGLRHPPTVRKTQTVADPIPPEPP